MAQPVLYTIPSFDATVGANIPFAFDGDQVFANELVIIDNKTEAQVYDITMRDWMRLYHTIGVDSGLVNGKYYACKVRVFNKANNASEWSSWRSFYCFKTPVLKFTNIKDGEIVQASEFTFRLQYQQDQKEPLNVYNVMLYNANRVLLSKSDNLYGAGDLQHTIRQLEDGTKYYIRAVGNTLNGMTVDTGYISFSVKYVVPSYWTYVDLSNNREDGSIRVSCNIRSITGEFHGTDGPKYIGGKRIDLRDDKAKVVFNDGFVQAGDFTVKLLGRDFVKNKEFFVMDDMSGTKVSLTYREGWFASNTLFAKGKRVSDEKQGCLLPYISVKATSANGLMVYTIMSDALDTLSSEYEYLIVFQRIGDVYSVSAKSVSIASMDQG